VRQPTEKSSGKDADPQPLVVIANDRSNAVQQTASVPALSVLSFYRRKPRTTTSIPFDSTGIYITRKAGPGKTSKINQHKKYR
jgi:hypothetical protein